MMWPWCLAVISLLATRPWSASANLWDAKADVLFVLDSSDAVGADDWQALRSTLLSLAQQWTIGLNDVQVSVLTYGDGVHNEFFFNEVQDVSQLASRLNSLSFHGGAADAADAMQYAYETSFDSEHGARVDVPHIIVHISNSPSANPSSLLQEAENAHNQGITVFDIGIGQGVEPDQLAKIASDPSSRYVLEADTYTSLSNLVPILSSRISNEIPVSAQALPSPSSCLAKADLVLLIDSSSSVGQEDYEHLEDFIKDLIVQLPIGQDQVQLGLVQFSGHPSLEFPLNMYSDRMAALKAVESMQFMGGGTNTADALRYVTSSVFTQNAGARTDVPRVLVTLTDGQSVDTAQTLAAADEARNNHIGLIAVGAGSSVSEQELQNIASDPDSDYVFKTTSFKDLQTLSTTILEASCSINSMITPEPTFPPGGASTADLCYDKLPSCNDYNERSCTDYEDWARENCLRRCGFCQTAEEKACEDKLHDCQSYGTIMCTDQQQRQWALENCKRFCGLCDSSASKLGFFGKCLYKGLAYVQSERWVDGCDYECVCEDAREGQYRCYNRCPVYHDLPPECTLIAVPNQCCLQPVCDFNQKLDFTEVAPGPSFNAQNLPVCEYMSKQYYQDQTWDVECDKKCTCVNATLGAYRCQSYCPEYPALPMECRLVQKPGQCCREPVCEFNTQTGSFIGFGTLSGPGVDMTPASTICQDDIVDCEGYGKAVCTQYTSWAQANCAKFCGFCAPDTLIPGPEDVCYYDGLVHSEGETWSIGCDTECVCEDAIYGYYRCYSRCPTYLNLPNGCHTVHVPGQCCSTVQCEYGTYYPSSTNVLSLGNGAGLTVRGLNGQIVEAVPTLSSGGTLPPGTLGGSTGLSNIRLDGCLFNGRMYIEHQQWHDGCRLTCTCQDASTGLISCRERCPKYDNVPDGCGVQPDSNDPCCSIPDCPASLGYVPVPVYGKAVQSIGAVATPSLPGLISGMFSARYTLLFDGITVLPPTAPIATLSPGALDYCEYKGQRYSHGQQWEDGCDYNCVCEDASTGSWRCIDKCERFVDIPQPYCHLEQDPVNACCQRPVCNFLVGHGQFEGNNSFTTTTTTTAPTTLGYREAMCVFKGVEYAEGQTWYDGCALKCKCDKADKNIYTCVTRCPAYTEEYDNCPLSPDPADPTCCMVPMCSPTPQPYVTPYPGATLAPTRIPPQIPVIPPGTVTGGETTGFCEFGGIQYSQDDTWEDGCDYTCVCVDSQNGLYKCTEKCERFGALPSICRLVTDYANPCCQIPRCSGQITSFNGSALPPGQSTPAPLAVCVYNNAEFLQGQEWHEGCERSCRCEDAENGLYVCRDRCPRYNAIPPECTLVSNPNDPCCLMPKCIPSVSETTLAPVPGLVPTLAPGKIVGSAIYPTPKPNPTGEIPSINYCIYAGIPYARGETWQDGCEFGCVCVDPFAGHYECKERCPRYTAIPSGCVLVKDVSDPCCERLVCSPSLVTSTPAPTASPLPQSSLSPVPGSTLSPSLGSTVSPPVGVITTIATPLPKDVCVYKNEYYTEGQVWFDGCDYSCTCEDAKEGIYRCTNRCPVYVDVPEECSFGPDPKDPLCCERPVCEFIPKPNQTEGYLIPPLRPGIVTGGSVTPTPLPYASPTPGPDGSTLAPPKPKNVCVYNGREYTQGQKWADGCSYDCICVDGITGRYQCSEKCLLWSSIPEECMMVTDVNNPCCQVLYCDRNKPTPQPETTDAPLPRTTKEPFVGPDGSTLAPPLIQTLAPPRSRCLYNGVPYMTGESWDDGCDLRCVCEDQMSNIYRCDQRCSMYLSTEGCELVTDPRDSCCQIPVCIPPPSTTNPNTAQPFPRTTQAPVTGPDGSTVFPPTLASTQVPSVTPSKQPYLVPTAMPGKQIGTVNLPNSNSGSGCIFNGVSYQQGQSWEDGCTRKCVCLNSTAAVYECTERCPRYVNMPSNCQLVLDLADPCCMTPLCQQTSTQIPQASATPELAATLSPPTLQTAGPTPSAPFYTSPPKKMCMFNGQNYAEGQQWYDGCDKVCFCIDGNVNYYTCSDRCPTYDNVPTECQMVASPDDPACCQVPQCVPTPGPNGYPTPGPNDFSTLDPSPTPTIFTNPPGVITGIAPTPSPRPGYPTPELKNVCVYNGREYQQGQQWQDGCDYNCQCVDAATGNFKCVQRCAVYPVVPRQCSLIPDPMDFCCKQLQCDFRQPTPNPFSPTLAPSRAPDPNLHTTVSPTPADVTTNGPSVGSIPTPSYQPPTVVPQFTFCVYNGVAYRQGETWNIGCEQVCTCDDSTQNYYSCANRCPIYMSLPPACSMTVNPQDSCCLVPECYVLPTPGPGLSVTLNPVPVPTAVPGIIIFSPGSNHPLKESLCVRNGVVYHPGDTWQEGCQYFCECLDTTGQYKCTERCAPYPNIPGECLMMADLSDSCCMKPWCPSISYTSTPVPLNTQSPEPNVSPTATPTAGESPQPTTPLYPLPKDLCVYGGFYYTQSQQWYDGCDKICVCENAKTGFYRCNDRCATFEKLQADCKLVPDARDPACCMVPECSLPDALNATGHIGVITGSGTPSPTPILTQQSTLTPFPGITLQPPTTGPGFTLQPPPTGVCLYYGRTYMQDQRWQDGCDYECECTDAAQGTYRCTDRCPRYSKNIASFCVMERDPGDPCCLKPDCYYTSTPLSGSSSAANPSPATANTLAPPYANTPFPTLHPTAYPLQEFCVYKGIPYSFGQTWNDGCDKTCRCEDVVTGQINCDDRCSSYQTVSEDCVLSTDPQDACCQVLECMDYNNNITVFKAPVGVFSGHSLPPNTWGPLTRNNVCIYHGRSYNEGEVWDDGCAYTCECVDGSQGKYMCKERCERFVRLPPTCTMIQNPTDHCCQTPYCLPWPPVVPTAAPGAIPTSLTLTPEGIPTASPGVTPSFDACIYNGQPYRQDQVWYEGCSAVCRCEEADANVFRCQERCVHYNPDPGCIMVPDLEDPLCCEIPQCPMITASPSPGVTPTPGIIDVTTLAPGRIIGIGKVPTPMPTLAPTPGPDGSTVTPTPLTGPDGSTIIPTPTPSTGCYYKGVIYKEMQRWEDGCEFVCECIDGITGSYTCSEKCPVLPVLPEDRCVLVQDPDELCCMKPYCDFANPTPFPNGTPTPHPTPAPNSQETLVPGTGLTPSATPTPEPGGTPTGFCVYNGAYFKDGDEWTDGCDLKCICDDAASGYFTCQDRCKSFGKLADECVLRVDPSDGCCLVPDCPQNPLVITPQPLLGVTGGSTPSLSYILTGGQNGSFTGIRGFGQPSKDFGVNTGFSNGCIYKQALYEEGAVWEDGCDYLCVCLDGLRGRYQCTDRCATYYFLPPVCEMEPDPADLCCQRAHCYPERAQTSPHPVSGQTAPGPSGTGSTANPGSTFTSHTGSGTVGNITPAGGSGPTGTGPTANPGSTFTSHTGSGTVGNITPAGGTGPTGTGPTADLGSTFTSHTGSGTVGNITPAGGTGPTGTGPTADLGSTFTSHTGSGTVGNITPAGGTGPTGTGPTADLGSTFTSHTGSGTVGNITPAGGTGPTGTGPTADLGSTFTSHTGSGTVGNITPAGGTGPTGTGPTADLGSTFTSHTGSGTVGNITPAGGSGPTGTGPTADLESTFTSHTGIGTVVNITPETPPGVSGTKPTVQSPESTLSGFSGTGPIINITPNVPSGVSGIGPTAQIGSSIGSFTGAQGMCVYKGVMYHTGDKWEDGCDLHCTCDDEMHGLFSCIYRCSAYSSLPSFCHLQSDSNDPCCKKPLCIVEGTELVAMMGGVPTLSPTLEPSVSNVIPLGTHTIISGSSRLPGQGIQTFYGGRSSCVYKGVEYIPGEGWDDGCDYTCTCIGDDVGLYRCVSKCPSYPALPHYCLLQSVPEACCQTLSCVIPNAGTYNPYPQLDPNPKPTSGPDGIYPTPQPTVDPQLILGFGVGSIIGGTGLPGGGQPVPEGFMNNLGAISDKCIDDLKMYNQTETWHHGCNATCTCKDSRSGYYECTERCLIYNEAALPVQCKMVQNPTDSCCQTPSCKDPNNQDQYTTNMTIIEKLYPIVGSYVGATSGFRPGFVPQGTRTYIGGSRNGCVYKDSLYGEGATWADGCDFNCQCVDGKIGLYQCTGMCPTYARLPPMCRLVKKDGECCPHLNCEVEEECRDKIDNCYHYREVSCSGAYESWAREHCPLYCGFCGSETPPPPCEDTVDCSRYGAEVCTNVGYADWVKSHCRKFCNQCEITVRTTTIWTTPESGCYDAISHCDEYGLNICTDLSYKPWVLTNCQKFCGICNSTEAIGSTTPEPCVDQLTDCQMYGQRICGGEYWNFARANCRKFCNLCNVTTQPIVATTRTTPSPCVDKLDNCEDYAAYCGGEYLAWSADNCPASCNICNYQLTTIQALTQPGWTVLLKGVAGVPGDLWQLWSTNSTANENVPEAKYLTNQFPGHYKPQIANQWDLCHFEKIKVTILSNGEEKANVTFDVRNAGKTDWFKPENVLSSTFDDLTTASEFFNMPRDPASGQEFAIGTFSDCEGSGWIFISTSQDCAYQNTGSAPQFYYSLSNTLAHLQSGQLGTGQVFAVLAQGGVCTGTEVLTSQSTFTGVKNGCYYKGQVYNEGVSWLDGCDYNCSCADGSTGQYYCSDLCPTYKDLPEVCSLDDQPGECCPKLNCPFEIGEGCYYKERTYPEGATWQDGCEYDCTCRDGTTGFYQCVGICSDWSALPISCHMEAPDPGFCCSRPVCPPNVTLTYTPR